MLRYLTVLLLVPMTTVPTFAEPPTLGDVSAEVFKPSVPVPKFKITLDDENLKILNRDPRKYVRANFDIDGKQFPDVGIHLKGAVGSNRAWNDRPALTVNFDKFVNGQAWMGLDKIHLNNSVQDGSFLNEIIGSELSAAMKLPTARAAHALVELYDKPQQRRKLGLYVLKEGYNKDFLQRHFPEGSKGNLYDGGFLQDIDAELKLDVGTDNKREDLKKLVAACREGDTNKRYEKVSALVDVDMMATNIALQYITGDWDGYARNRNNYRIYFRSNDGKAVVIPHGMDQLFGDPRDSLRHSANPLISRAIMESDTGRKLVNAKMREMVEKHFKPEVFDARIDQWVKHLQDTVRGTSNEQYGKDFEANAKNYKGRLKERYDYIIKELPKLK